MRILTADEATQFEQSHTQDIWFYEDARHFSSEKERDIFHVSGVFNSVFKHVDYSATSTMTNDKFIVFEHDNHYAILAMNRDISDYVLYTTKEHFPVIEHMINTYLRAYNPNNLDAFPVLRTIEVVKVKKVRATKATKDKKEVAQKPKRVAKKKEV